MPSRAVLVPALLGLIIQVALTPSVLGSNGRSYGSSTPILRPILLKMAGPELVNLTLQATLHEITASWSIISPESYSGVRFRVTTAGVNQTVSQNSFTISGLPCNTSYNVKVSPVDAAGADYGVSTNATITTLGVSDQVDLTLYTTRNEIFAKWSPKNSQCSSQRFRVTTVGVDKIVVDNFYIITGLACNTNYSVTVSPVDLKDAPYGVSTTASILVTGVPQMGNLALQATLHEIAARWTIQDAQCFPNARFQVTTAGVNQTVSQTFYNFSGLLCNTSYYVKVSPVDASGVPYGVARNATIITKVGAPEMGNLTLKATLHDIAASWALQDPECFPNVRFRVITTGVDKIVSTNSYNFSGLPCNTSYNVKVSPVDAVGAFYGIARNATIVTKGVPELVNLTLQATLYQITAKWALKDPKCFPDARFRVTTAGVDNITSQNLFNISGLACNTSYYVQISPVDASGASYGVSANATIITKGVPELVNLTLQASRTEITARWSLKDPKCFPSVRFRVVTAGVDTIISQTTYNISRLACNTSYNVKVSPVDAAGAYYGVSTNASIVWKLAPQLVNLTLQATLYGITASWSMISPECYGYGRFHITTAGVDQFVSRNSTTIGGLACNTNYDFKVSPVNAAGADYGVSTNATIKTNGVPEVVSLVLQASLKEITAKWSLKGDPKCFPGLKFRVTTAGVDTIVSQTSYNISRLACTTLYNVKVSPVDAAGASYGVSTNASTTWNLAPEVVNLTVQTILNEITMRWSLKDPQCFPAARFRVTTANTVRTVSENSFIYTIYDCKSSLYIKVSAVDAAGADYGVYTNTTIITKKVPEVSYLTLRATLNNITAIWALIDSTCFPNAKFRVSTAGVDKITSQKSYNISGLACDTSYNVKVSAVDTDGLSYGIFKNASIIPRGVPELANLTLQVKINVITVSWSVKEPKCFSDARFRVTTEGVDQIVSQNSFNISGLACYYSYAVKVSPIDAAGANIGGYKTATIMTSGETMEVKLIPMVAESLVAQWASVQGSCPNYSGYEVTLSGLNGVIIGKLRTSKKYLVFPGLAASTAYQVRVQPLDSKSWVINRSVTAQQTTLDKTSAAGRCPFPTLKLAAWSTFVMCAGVEKPTPSINIQANDVCYKKHPSTNEVPYLANLFMVATGWTPFGDLQDYLRVFNYTEELLVNGFYRNGSWVWAFGTNFAGSYPIDPSLLVGLPAGGDGPNDYKMLYADPKKDYRLSAAKDGYAFGGMICAFPLKV